MNDAILELLPGIHLFIIIPMLALIILVPLAIKQNRVKNKRRSIDWGFAKDLEKKLNIDINQFCNETVKSRLESSRKKYLGQICILVTFICICAAAIFYNIVRGFDSNISIIEFLIEAIIEIILLFIVQKITSNYEMLYKKIIVEPILKSLYPDIIYNSEKNIHMQSEYAKLGFDNMYYLVKCETKDYFEGMIDGKMHFEMTELIAYKEDFTDSFSYRNRRLLHRAVVFRGLFSRVECIKGIGENKILILHSTTKVKPKKYKVELENTELKKDFNVFSENPESASKFLTNEIINIILEFYKSLNVCFDIIIMHNQIYFRFFTNYIFETDVLEKEINKDQILLYCFIIDFITKFTRSFNAILDSVD